MRIEMKLSELTYDLLKVIGLEDSCMPDDYQDSLRRINSEATLDDIKDKLTSRYGDVNIIVDTTAIWSRQIEIDDAKWKEEFDKYCEEKAAWCARYGSD